MRYIIHTDGAGVVGERENVSIGADTEGELINLFEVQARLPEKVKFLGWNKDNSVVNIWIKEPVYDDKTQMVQFIGGVPGGFRGRAILGTLQAEPRRAGTLEFAVDDSSKAFLNDGLGTAAQVTSVPATLSVAPRDGQMEWWIGGGLLIAIICGILWTIWRLEIKNQK